MNIWCICDNLFCIFQLSVLGESFSEIPEIFIKGKEKLGDCISYFGYVESVEKFYEILCEADIVVSTADHEFFGVSMWVLSTFFVYNVYIFFTICCIITLLLKVGSGQMWLYTISSEIFSLSRNISWKLFIWNAWRTLLQIKKLVLGWKVTYPYERFFYTRYWKVWIRISFTKVFIVTKCSLNW